MMNIDVMLAKRKISVTGYQLIVESDCRLTREGGAAAETESG